MRLGILSSHPIQYQVPWFRALAQALDVQVFFSHRPDARQQGEGFGKAFQWDVDLLTGYEHHFLSNISRRPGTDHFFGCDTPDIKEIIRGGSFGAFIVSGWNLKSYWQAVRACRRGRLPVLVRGDSHLLTPRSRLKRWAKEIAYRAVLRQFDGFLVVGKRNREYLLHYGVPENRLFPAPHFVDNSWFANRAQAEISLRGKTRVAWGVDESDLVVLFVGKFIQKKRPADMLEALAHMRDLDLSVCGVFVGAGELEPLLRGKAAQLDVRVRFEGFRNQTELPRYFASADVITLPSDGGETWGLVVNEAMACGLPAVVSDAVGCAPDLIEEGRTGFTFPMGDVKALAGRLARIGQMRKEGFDFAQGLRDKTADYSVTAAVAGTFRALTALRAGRKP